MLSWDEQTCYSLVNRMLEYLKYTEKIEKIKWLTRVASTDNDETEIQFVVKICSINNVVVLRISSNEQAQVKEQIDFQKQLHQSGVAVPEVFNIIEVALSERLIVTAYLEEFIDGIMLSKDDFYGYAAFLGKLHEQFKLMNYHLSRERNHLLYDTKRIMTEMRALLDADSTNKIEELIQRMIILMRKTKIKMSQLKRYPVHGDYATNNLIKKEKTLFLVDFELVGLGYLPEEVGEALAEIVCSCFCFCHWKEQLEQFLFVYKSNTRVSEKEIELMKDVAIIALVIRVLHTELEKKTKLFLCDDLLKSNTKNETEVELC